MEASFLLNLLIYKLSSTILMIVLMINSFKVSGNCSYLSEIFYFIYYTNRLVVFCDGGTTNFLGGASGRQQAAKSSLCVWSDSTATRLCAYACLCV